MTENDHWITKKSYNLKKILRGDAISFFGILILNIPTTLLMPSCRILEVRPHYAARHIAAKCSKAAWQKLRHATSICGRCVGLAAACRSMLRGLKIQSANCRSHQKKPRGI